jgi:hypothetical protein
MNVLLAGCERRGVEAGLPRFDLRGPKNCGQYLVVRQLASDDLLPGASHVFVPFRRAHCLYKGIAYATAKLLNSRDLCVMCGVESRQMASVAMSAEHRISITRLVKRRVAGKV